MLEERSVEVILAGQAETGAYLACPDFGPYRFSWFRDGSFIADAMSRVGEVDSAERFFDWCAAVIEERADVVRSGGHLHARYTADRRESLADWPTFQTDGYGLWLWALRGHCGRHGRPDARWLPAVELTVEYLRRRGADACVHWWEERSGHHAATLASIAAGLEAWGEPAELPEPEDRLDASLLALPLLGRGEAPLDELEARLVSPGGGVHRHEEDTYYGGGEWLLLTAMLGLAYRLDGRLEDAHATLAWVEAHATPDGRLPEQSQDHLLAPAWYEPWVEKWGPPPCPLLWSHAMHLTLAAELGRFGH
ncbi:MAG: glycoside hydrolase family 15 protein [Thermoleophilia bacterium]|nr:glycoside hydrolase family 15 protein [Thermoleophilia bacterium]